MICICIGKAVQYWQGRIFAEAVTVQMYPRAPYTNMDK